MGIESSVFVGFLTVCKGCWSRLQTLRLDVLSDCTGCCQSCQERQQQQQDWEIACMQWRTPFILGGGIF